MIFQGLILCLACGCLLWRACMERRTAALIGFSLICAAVAVSAFRRIVYAPGQMHTQMALDLLVCSVFFAGAVTIVIDERIRASHDIPPSGGGGDSWRRTLGPMLLAASALLMSGSLLSAWDGRDFDHLTFPQVLEEIARDDNPGAAMEQGRRFVEQFEKELRRLELNGRPAQRAWARTTRENLARSTNR